MTPLAKGSSGSLRSIWGLQKCFFVGEGGSFNGLVSECKRYLLCDCQYIACKINSGGPTFGQHDASQGLCHAVLIDKPHGHSIKSENKSIDNEFHFISSQSMAGSKQFVEGLNPSCSLKLLKAL